MTYKCCICRKEFEGYGNNAEPLMKSKDKSFKSSEDRCCHECNSKFVIPFRVAVINRDVEVMEHIQEQVYRHIRKGNKRK